MDRIEDIIEYLNAKELNDGTWRSCAFDFIEFMAQSAVMIDAITTLTRIIDTENKTVRSHNQIFKHKHINHNICNKSKKHEDDRYFEYIRSISAIHPLGTDRHQQFQHFSEEVSPFVVWSNGLREGDISLHIYDKMGSSSTRSLQLYIEEIFNYIKWKYYNLPSLARLIPEIENQVVMKYRQEIIPAQNNYPSYLYYLEVLAHEAEKRTEYISEYINTAAYLIDTPITNPSNQQNYDRFNSVLKLAIEDTRQHLQHMDMGIMDSCELPLCRLQHLDIRNEGGMNYHYALSKIHYFVTPGGDREFARTQVEYMLKFLDHYIDITEDDCYILSSRELYTLVHLALYLHEIQQLDCSLGRKYII